eukprot:12409567-Karenia_brevis.AAC.1
MRNCLRPLWVECTGEGVAAMIALCQDHVKHGTINLKKDKQDTDKAKGRKSFAFSEDDCPPIPGK